MQLLELRTLLQDYPLNSFVGTPKAMSINQKQLSFDIEQTFSKLAKDYLYRLSDMVAHNDEFFSDNPSVFSDYLSKLIGTTCSLKEMIQVCEDMTSVFDSELDWARGMATRSMLSILDRVIQELAITKQRIRGSRFVSRVRDDVIFIISQKIPQILYILSTAIAIQLKQVAPNAIVLAIGKGMKVSQICP